LKIEGAAAIIKKRNPIIGGHLGAKMAENARKY